MRKLEGLGWRLARDTSRGKFSLLVGGDGWAIELTEQEGKKLYEVMKKLLEQFDFIKAHLMEEEPLNIDIEVDQWKAFLNGDKTEWSLKLILNGDGIYTRGVEVFWPAPVAQTVTSAMRTMWD